MLNLSDYKEHFCEYILFRYAWANEFVKEPFPENLYEYYDSFAKAYRYLIEKIGYPAKKRYLLFRKKRLTRF